MLISTSFDLKNFGYEECRPEKSYGPAIRDYFLFHYIIDGVGYFESCGERYEVEKGQMFIISPNDLSYYRADKIEPWIYTWISFSGEGADELMSFLGLSGRDKVIDIPIDSNIGEIMYELSSITTISIKDNFLCISLMYKFISELIRIFPKQSRVNDNTIHYGYISSVEKFIRNNYQNDIKISDISKMLGLDRSYLSSLFRNINKKSIQEFLIDLRLRKALSLLRSSTLSILEISRSVGYTDQFVFSKAFKKKYGLSPSKMRDTPEQKC